MQYFIYRNKRSRQLLTKIKNWKTIINLFSKILNLYVRIEIFAQQQMAALYSTFVREKCKMPLLLW